jgi:hypothetical protein
MKFLMVVAMVVCASTFAVAQELTPEQIILKVDEVRSPQLDYTTNVQVVTSLPKGRTQSSTFEVYVKGRDKTVVKTLTPEMERGRVLLMRENNLWGYFPTVSKPLRLSMQERLTGQVSNGDIARVNFSGDYDAKLLREEKLDGTDCYVLELSAKNESVTYGKAILWAQKADFWPRKAEFYGYSGRLLKNCTYEEFKELAGAIRPSKLVMSDPIVKGRTSVVTYNTITVTELPEKYFTKEYMKKFME